MVEIFSDGAVRAGIREPITVIAHISIISFKFSLSVNYDTLLCFSNYHPSYFEKKFSFVFILLHYFYFFNDFYIRCTISFIMKNQNFFFFIFGKCFPMLSLVLWYVFGLINCLWIVSISIYARNILLYVSFIAGISIFFWYLGYLYKGWMQE